MKLDSFPTFVGADVTPIITAILLGGVSALMGFAIGALVTTLLWRSKGENPKVNRIGGGIIIALTVLGAVIVGPASYISSANGHASALKEIHAFQVLVEHKYGVSLSEQQAETLAADQGQEFAPGITAYGHTTVNVSGTHVDVGLYKQHGLFSLVDRQKLADGLENATLPRVER